MEVRLVLRVDTVVHLVLVGTVDRPVLVGMVDRPVPKVDTVVQVVIIKVR